MACDLLVVPTSLDHYNRLSILKVLLWVHLHITTSTYAWVHSPYYTVHDMGTGTFIIVYCKT